MSTDIFYTGGKKAHKTDVRHNTTPNREIGTGKYLGKPFWTNSCLQVFFISNTFISNIRLKLAKIKQELSKKQTERLLFEAYQLPSSTLSFKNNREYSKTVQKTYVSVLMRLYDQFIIKMNMIRNQITQIQSHRYNNIDATTLI